VILNIVIVLVQGWSCFSPTFDGVSFVSFYLELPIMLGMFIVWKVWKRTRFVNSKEVDLVTDTYTINDLGDREGKKKGWKGIVEWIA
jgi:AAT family amino acid transporter